MAGRSFNGTSDVMTVTAASPINNLVAMSIAIWVQPVPTVFDPFISKQNAGLTAGWQIGFWDSGECQFQRRYSGTPGEWDSGIQFTSGVLNSLVITHTGLVADDAVFYKNGSAVTTNEFGAPTGSLGDDSALNLTVGKDSGSATFGAATQASYLAIWSAALSAREAAKYHAGGLLPRLDALVGFWPMNKNASPETDLKNGNNGALTGTAFVSTSVPALQYEMSPYVSPTAA